MTYTQRIFQTVGLLRRGIVANDPNAIIATGGIVLATLIALIATLIRVWLRGAAGALEDVSRSAVDSCITLTADGAMVVAAGATMGIANVVGGSFSGGGGSFGGGGASGSW